MDDLQDVFVLEELLDTVEQFRQRKGSNPERSRTSWSRKLREELSRFSEDCRTGALKGRQRKRRSGRLFLKIVRHIR